MKPTTRITIVSALVIAVIGSILIIRLRGHHYTIKGGTIEVIAGTVTGKKILTGVLIIASTGTIPDPLPAIHADKMPDPPFYMTTSDTHGKYNLEVRASRDPYNMRAFYSVLRSDNQTFSTISKAKSGIMVGAGAEVPDQNFIWP